MCFTIIINERCNLKCTCGRKREVWRVSVVNLHKRMKGTATDISTCQYVPVQHKHTLCRASKCCLPITTQWAAVFPTIVFFCHCPGPNNSQCDRPYCTCAQRTSVEWTTNRYLMSLQEAAEKRQER